MSKVALVYPHFRTRAPTELLFTPLGLAFLASQLKRLEIETKIFDCTFSTMEQVREALLAYRPDIVGIYSMVTLSRNTFRIADLVRSNLPDSLLVAGGPLPTLYPDRFSKSFDVVFRGEADLSFPNFCKDFFHLQGAPRERISKLSLNRYEGIFIRQNSSEINVPLIHYRDKEIASFPLPDRGDFDHAAYQHASLLRDGTKTTSIITTFGCPFDCDFCSRPVFGNLFRRRDLNVVFDEIEQIHQLGYDHLWIADDNFTLNLNYLREFCRGMTGRGITWSCLSRVTGLDLETCRLMKEAGCRRVYLGLETGSQVTLQLMNKKASVKEGARAVQLFQEAGIEAAAFFIVGYPGESISSIEETFRFALSLPLKEISFNVPYPLPGSRLFERVAGVDMNRDWDKENEVTFVYASEFDEEWLRRRITETLAAFEEKQSDRKVSRPISSA